MMKTSSAMVETSEENDCDASSQDELPSEQHQWCPLLELCFHDTVGRVLVKALGVGSATETCVFAIFIAPVDREPQDQKYGVARNVMMIHFVRHRFPAGP